MNARTFSVNSFLGKLAAPAEGFDLYRTAQQCELSEASLTVEELLHFGYLDVLYASAADAKDVVMRLDVAIIAGNIVEQRYLARLSHRAKLLEDTMDGGQRYVGMPAAHRRIDLVGTRMVLGIEQGLYYCEALGRYGNPAPAASRDELAESLNRIPLTGASIYQPDPWHKQLLSDQRR